MNPIVKTIHTVEHHCLKLPYAALRMRCAKQLNKLIPSLEEHGQLVPVIVVPVQDKEGCWMLLDGYLRIKGLKQLRQDTVKAEIWNCEAAIALCILLNEKQGRAWDILEEALLLQELVQNYGFSQQALATHLGRDQSWVSRRLLLVEGLPNYLQQAILQGKLSIWVATRILVPMARAIPLHAEQLLQHLKTISYSTRQLQQFYTHYQQSNKTTRERMVENPALFFKSVAEKEKQVASAKLAKGPEGEWRQAIAILQQYLKRLEKLVPTLFSPAQLAPLHQSLLESFVVCEKNFLQLHQRIRSYQNVTD